MAAACSQSWTGVHLEEQPALGHALPSAPMAAGAPSSGAAQALGEENPADGGTREDKRVVCRKHFG